MVYIFHLVEIMGLVMLLFLAVLNHPDLSEQQPSDAAAAGAAQLDGDSYHQHWTFHEMKANSAFKCQPGYFLRELNVSVSRYGFYNESSPALSATMSLPTTNIYSDDLDSFYRHSPCPSIARCLGYQACLFKFGCQFCRKDPLPGVRKHLIVNATCARDKFHGDVISGLSSASLRDKLKNSNDFYKYISFTPLTERNLMLLKYDSVKLKDHLIPEDEINLLQCPHTPGGAISLGYAGNCSQRVSDQRKIVDDLWHVLGRCPRAKCRKEILQVYCAYQLNSDAKCLPPKTVEKGSVSEGKLRFSFASLPKTGFRPNISQYKHIYHDEHMALIPVKLGFLLIVHTAEYAVGELLEQIYRPWHFYVIHIDKRATDFRRKISRVLSEFFPNRTNIRILPIERSFVTSWGSYGILRAELEGAEELLRMGIWDFLINLSGADLPIRNVEDLEFQLAPHRGSTILRLNKKHPADDPVGKAIWHSCGGYVYKVSSPRSSRQLPDQSASQWGVFSREFMNYIVSENRESAVDDLQFLLETAFIQDELYLVSMLRHSHFKSTFISAGIVNIKGFVPDNALMLCRHSEHADACGQGPGDVSYSDVDRIMDESNAFTFARKFSTDYTSATRKTILEWSRGGYYKHIGGLLTKDFTEQLTMLLAENLPTSREVSSTSQLRITSYRKLKSSHPCWQHHNYRGVFIVYEYVFIVEANVLFKDGTQIPYRAAFDMFPKFTYFPGGHLKIMHATTMGHKSGMMMSTPSTAYPVPVMPSMEKVLFIALLFQWEEQTDNEECKDDVAKSSDQYEYIELITSDRTAEGQPKSQTTSLVVTLVNPSGHVHCTKDVPVEFDRIPKNQDHKHIHPVELHCGPYSEGFWTVRVHHMNRYKNNDKAPHEYQLKIYMHDFPRGQPLPMDVVRKLMIFRDIVPMDIENRYYTPRKTKPSPFEDAKRQPPWHGQAKEMAGEPQNVFTLKKDTNFIIEYIDIIQKSKAEADELLVEISRNLKLELPFLETLKHSHTSRNGDLNAIQHERFNVFHRIVQQILAIIPHFRTGDVPENVRNPLLEGFEKLKNKRTREVKAKSKTHRNDIVQTSEQPAKLEPPVPNARDVEKFIDLVIGRFELGYSGISARNRLKHVINADRLAKFIRQLHKNPSKYLRMIYEDHIRKIIGWIFPYLPSGVFTSIRMFVSAVKNLSKNSLEHKQRLVVLLHEFLDGVERDLINLESENENKFPSQDDIAKLIDLVFTNLYLNDDLIKAYAKASIGSREVDAFIREMSDNPAQFVEVLVNGFKTFRVSQLIHFPDEIVRLFDRFDYDEFIGNLTSDLVASTQSGGNGIAKLRSNKTQKMKKSLEAADAVTTKPKDSPEHARRSIVRSMGLPFNWPHEFRHLQDIGPSNGMLCTSCIIPMVTFVVTAVLAKLLWWDFRRIFWRKRTVIYIFIFMMSFYIYVRNCILPVAEIS